MLQIAHVMNTLNGILELPTIAFGWEACRVLAAPFNTRIKKSLISLIYSGLREIATTYIGRNKTKTNLLDLIFRFKLILAKLGKSTVRNFNVIQHFFF